MSETQMSRKPRTKKAAAEDAANEPDDPFAALDAVTKEMLRSKLPQYDPSVFVEGIMQPDGNLILYVPAAKRMDWFRADYPDGVVVPEPPVINGRRVTVVAKVYKTREDLRDGLPAAVNMASRFMGDNDLYAVDSCVTRAQSRALRDLGYDVPVNAHVIEGWTPITKQEEGNAPVVEDALESGVSLRDRVPKFLRGDDIPAVRTPELINALEKHAEQQTAPMPAPTPAPAPSPVPQVKEPEPVKEPAKKPAESAPVSAKPVAPPKAEVNPAPMDEDPLIRKALDKFQTLANAEAYTSRVLGGKSVGEQPDNRVAYYAKNAKVGKVADEALGLAMLLVAKARNL